MKKLFLLVILIVFSLANLIAQEKREMNDEMFEKIKAEKISFLSAKMNLTPSEAQTFWPVYNEFGKKKFEIQREIHEFEHMPDEKFASLSDAEVEKLTDQLYKFIRERGTIAKRIQHNVPENIAKEESIDLVPD